MPSVKISALPASTGCDSTDVLPIVTGGVTEKVPINVLLTAVGGDVRQMLSTTGNGITVSGITSDVIITGNSLGKVVINNGSLDVFQLQASGDCQIVTNTTDSLTLSGGGHGIAMGPGGNLLIQNAVGFFVDVFYTPATPANWVGPVLTERAAIDRLAAAIVLRTAGGPIL